MKRILLGLLAVLSLLVAALALYLWRKQPLQRPAVAESFEATPARLARGRYLYDHLLDCGGCHTPRDWKRWGGPALAERQGAGGDCLGHEAGMPGTVCFPNITPDRATGIGEWSDGEIARAVREGVRRDGRALFPLMPWEGFRHLSEEDTRSLVVHLRTLAPVRNAVQPTRLDFPLSVIVKFMPRPLEVAVPDPPADDPIKRGRYLARVAGCEFCHTPTDDKGMPVPGREFAGGQFFLGPWGKVASTNLTPHLNGIGPWTRENFLGLFRSFADREAVTVPVEPGQNTVMPWLAYTGLSDADLGALYDFLRTVKPQPDIIERRPRPARP